MDLLRPQQAGVCQSPLASQVNQDSVEILHEGPPTSQSHVLSPNQGEQHGLSGCLVALPFVVSAQRELPPATWVHWGTSSPGSNVQL